jgi:hypothetical protein
MRRVVGVLLIALGVFALTLAFSLRFVVVDRLALAPLDPDTETVAQGTGMTVFYAGSLKDPSIPRQRTDATLTARRVVQGDLKASEVEVNGDVAMWWVGLVVEDERSTLISAVEQHVCVDRRTAVAANPCSGKAIVEGSNQNTDITMSGLQYKFPFDTQKKDYAFFDITLRTATPIKYDGAEKINGLDTYRFVQTIEPTKLEDRDVPGDLVGGSPTESVKAQRWYQNVRTVWVEPYTGVIVKGQEESRQWLRAPDGRDGQVLVAGTLTFTPQTIQNQVDNAEESKAKLRALKVIGPLVALLLGVVLVVLGVLLVVRGRRARPGPASHRGRKPTRVPEPV